MQSKVTIQKLFNAIKANVVLVPSLDSNYRVASKGDPYIAMAIMTMMMSIRGYDMNEIQAEIGVGDKLMNNVQEYLAKSLEKEDHIIHQKLKLVTNYLKLNP